MARREKDVTITAEGRDKGKTFRLTEMSASQAERWAARAFLAMSRSGVDLPDHAVAAGMAGLASFGFQAMCHVSFAEAEPLMNEMFECITFVPAPGMPPRRLIEEDIEEVKTRIDLRAEVLELHTGFSITAALSILGRASAVQTGNTPVT